VTNAAPVLAAILNKSTPVGTAVSTPAASATDADGPSLTYSATALPAGVSINSASGVFSGTATTIGTYIVVVTASDGYRSDTKQFQWTVAAPTSGLNLVNPGPQTNTAGDFVLLQLQYTASGKTGTTVSFSAVNLPPGLLIDYRTGAIRGTIGLQAAGIYQVTVTMRAGTASTSQSFPWTVNPKP
jgi:hypothetical protein